MWISSLPPDATNPHMYIELCSGAGYMVFLN